MLPHVNPAILMGFYFFPRGGSAHVARSLCRALHERDWWPTLFSGSVGGRDEPSDALRFFRGIRCKSLDYTPARSAWEAGVDPSAGSPPMHGSYEAKQGVPDRIFFDLDDRTFERQVSDWTAFLARFSAGDADVAPGIVHLHHLTPMHQAVRVLWPGVPIVTHLHGTELKMLASARHHNGADGTQLWTNEWVERMRQWADASDRVVVVSDQDRQLAHELLPGSASRVAVIGNGVDSGVFSPHVRSGAERMALWKRVLVDEPRGWRPGGGVGSLAYTERELSAFLDRDGQVVPVVIFAGRFLRFKRLQLLIEAHHLMRTTTGYDSVLVIAGGFPGEWEDEHPFDTVQRLGAQGVFFAGWHDHDELAAMLTCSDVFAAPSVDEPFGLVYLEAMAAGLPPIATTTGGPMSFINVDHRRPTGWLVPPDDVAATALALTAAVGNPATRSQRGRRAARFVREHYSWQSAAQAFASLYGDVIDDHRRLGALSPVGR
jgi:glycosyltransferase involved in cell wall biosynthesis